MEGLESPLVPIADAHPDFWPVDLSGGNIMLCSDAKQPHGFSARVADFGLSRLMDVGSRMVTNTYGTVRN